MNNKTDFEKCTNTRQRNERVKISCKLGLWSVESCGYESAKNEAMHYFEQYKSDGEYSSIIGGDDVVTTMVKRGLV